MDQRPNGRPVLPRQPGRGAPLLPVDVIRRNGELLSLNTRSTLALRRSGVSPQSWNLRDVTGDPFFERILTQRFGANAMSGGSDVIRVTGAGPNASLLK